MREIIKLSDKHYIVIDKSIAVEEHDWVVERDNKSNTLQYKQSEHGLSSNYYKITHSTINLAGEGPLSEKIVVQRDDEGKPLISAQFYIMDFSYNVKHINISEIEQMKLDYGKTN